MYDTLDYRGYTIRIAREDYAENPFEAWDCEPPILVYYDGYIREHGLEFRPPFLTKEEIAKNAQSILEELGERCMFTILREGVEGYRYYNDSVDIVNDRIVDHFESLVKSDALEFLATVWRWKGCEAVCKASRGYSQGDYAEVLAVATPEWAEKVGASKEHHAKSLEYAVKLYGHWAWGDVYGYSVYAPFDEEQEEGDFIDACGGFYGDDPEESGLLGAARSAIEYHIESQRKQRIEQVKTWIKNSVPLYVRQNMSMA